MAYTQLFWLLVQSSFLTPFYVFSALLLPFCCSSSSFIFFSKTCIITERKLVLKAILRTVKAMTGGDSKGEVGSGLFIPQDQYLAIHAMPITPGG